MDKVYDYIIIGSGFGGSVSAMRLSEKGYSVLVIEKGKEFKKEDYPKTNWNFRKFFWAPALKWFGFLKLTFFKEVFILSGVGVGGGSLGYANTHMYPSDDFFNNPVWSGLAPEEKGWKEILEPHYGTARFMLGTVKNKLFNRADEILKEVARDMNKEESHEGVSVGVYFGDKDKQVDPYFNGLGPLRQGCTECAGCMVGCKDNAKNTLDKNYLYFARKFGTEIVPDCLVNKVEYQGGEYQIHTQSSRSWFKKNTDIYKSKNLVVAGGVLGTMDLMLNQKHALNTLPKLSNTLGQNIRTNSEMLAVVTAKEKLNHGIAITSVFNPDEHTHIEVVKYPDDSNSMKVFATMTAGPGHPLLRTLKLMLNIITSPIKYFGLMFNGDWAKNSVIFLIMQSLDSSMKMVLKKFPFKRMTIINNAEDRVPAYIDIGQEVMMRYAKKVNGVPQNALAEILLDTPSTAHILGGCPMGASAETGVVNNKFEVFGYPGMHILDGSIMPCNLGVNPSLTITALSEYAMSQIPEKEGNTNTSLKKQLEIAAEKNSASDGE